MQNLPSAEVYEKEFKYFPWGILIREIQDFIVKSVPQNGRVLDLLCGTGYLLGELRKKRPDLNCVGVDMEPEFVEFGKRTYPEIEFVNADVRTWTSDESFDAVLCTAGLHHLPYSEHESFVAKIASLVSPTGFAMVADPYIDDYSNETERKVAAARLGYEYLADTVKSGASEDVVKAAVDILSNDVLGVEFKNSIKRTEPTFSKYFGYVEKHKTWPVHESEYGDYYFILKK